jgi:two-component system, response regulator
MNGEPLRILLVEDNLDHAELVKRSFDSNRIANCLFHAVDGEQAINYLAKKEGYSASEFAEYPNLILLDLRLPKVDGIDVLKYIKSNDKIKTIPVVILTSSDAETDIIKAYYNHANSYLVKPMDFNKFNELMNELGFYWLVWNQRP